AVGGGHGHRSVLHAETLDIDLVLFTTASTTTTTILGAIRVAAQLLPSDSDGTTCSPYATRQLHPEIEEVMAGSSSTMSG
ncbi:hypothetical protein Dimus_007889, partial [Dionaea muscipula]